ncbi:MAG: hypothetical protein OEQ53_08430 [Saprospiraceae bacterium]|nr:hypothetical protein [Saprospiraceae bacterium]
MRKIFATYCVLLFVTTAFAQLAIIQDKDGYTNVRLEPYGQSEVIHMLYNDQVFWYDEDSIIGVSDWIRIYVPKDAYSLNCQEQAALEGYVHRSRIQPLDQLQKCQGDSLSFRYVIEPFDPEHRIIDTEGEWIVAIDGRSFWGTDGVLPMTQIAEIQVNLWDARIHIPKVLYSDIFQSNNDFDIYRREETFFIYNPNSDGAGYYEIVWVITKDGVQQRLVGSTI